VWRQRRRSQLLQYILAVGIVWGWLMLATLQPLCLNSCIVVSFFNNAALPISLVLCAGQIAFVDR
jgi:hypothetical protein